VTLDIDASGILHVTARDKGTGKEQKITVQGSTGMDDKEVDRLIKEAEANREADKAKKEGVEARNHADSTIHQAEKTLSESVGKYEEVDGEKAKAILEDLKKVLADTASTREQIEEKTKELSEVMMKIGGDIYAKASTEEKKADTDTTADTKNDDGSVEADVQEK
jgi:molecular chaperone DnaK